MVEIRRVEYVLRNATEYDEEARNDKAIDCEDYEVVTTVDSDNVFSKEVSEVLDRYSSAVTFNGYKDMDVCEVYYAVMSGENTADNPDYDSIIFVEWDIPNEDDDWYDDTEVPNYANWEDM